jgi:hypothetical protein
MLFSVLKYTAPQTTTNANKSKQYALTLKLRKTSTPWSQSKQTTTTSPTSASNIEFFQGVSYFVFGGVVMPIVDGVVVHAKSGKRRSLTATDVRSPAAGTEPGMVRVDSLALGASPSHDE